MLYLTKPYSTLKLGREVDERAYAIWLGEPRNDSIDWFPSVKANDILCVGRSGYFLKQGIFIYKYDSCVDFFNTITEQFSFWKSDKWFKIYARFKYRNLLLNVIQDGRHLCCIYGRIQCRLLVKRPISTCNILYFA